MFFLFVLALFTIAIRQAIKAAIFIAVKNLVASLAQNIALAAQYRRILAIKQPGHRMKTFFRLITLLQRHFAFTQRRSPCRIQTGVSLSKSKP